MVHSRHGYRVTDRAHDRPHILAANSSREICNADHSTSMSDATQLIVAEIALVVTRASHAGMRDHHRPSCHLQYIVDGGRRSVSKIDQDAPALQLLHQFATKRRKAALVNSMRG